MFYGNGQSEFCAAQSRTGYADTPADQGTQHGKKAFIGVFDVRLVGTVRSNIAILIEQIFAGYGNLIEPYFTIVHPVQSQLIPIVLNSNTGQQFVFFISYGHQNGMYAFILPVYDQLGEYCGYFRVQGIADVFFVIIFSWSMDDDAIGILVIGCGGLSVSYTHL